MTQNTNVDISSVQPPDLPGKKTITTAVFVSFLVGILVGLSIMYLVNNLGPWDGFFEKLTAGIQTPDIKNPVSLNREKFSFKHPGNWKEEIDPNIDHQNNITLDIPSGGMFELRIYDLDYDPEELVNDQVEIWENDVVKKSYRQSFNKIKQFTGHGITVTGFQDGIWKVKTRTFAFKTDKHVVFISEYVFSEDEKTERPGFDLIYSTLKIN